ncbi:MAG TPA: ABC transporter ATP-binding protein [Isosphaeraceae bacterium]|jgi:ABC-type multidrug transport system fused ATPase/permease subunit|nr:ABC transporter ATP-binding protein [Isosphaeraceae bacterium]
MQAVAYRRARNLCNSRPRAVVTARVLGVVRSLLLLILAGIAGLYLALLATRGAYDPADVANVEAKAPWARPALDDALNPADAGLYPLVARNWDATSNPLHRAGARVLAPVLRSAEVLRSNRSALLALMAAALADVILLSVIDQFRRAALIDAVGKAIALLRRQVHRQIYRLGQSALPTEGIGPTLNLFTKEIDALHEGLLADLDISYRVPVLAIGLLLLAAFLSWYLTLFLLALVGVIALTVRPLERRTRQVAEVASRDAAVHLSLLQEDLGLIRTVRVFGMEGVDNERFDEHLERHRLADGRRLLLGGASSPTTLQIVGAAAVVAAGVLGYNVLDGRVSLASAVVLTTALLALLKPTADWVAMRRSVRQAARAAAAVAEFLDRRPELQQPVGAHFLAPLRERISFEDVTLVGPSGRTLLDGLSAEIPALSRTAIMGRDEDSKHALACLIPRLIDPKSGRVRIDGVDLREVTLESLRAQVATVLQNDLVFSDSVTTNIGLGDESFGLPRIIEAAKVAHAHHFIQDLPHGYDTIIGPLGHYLRADEQYRIGLARAYLHDPSIVIIEEPGTPIDDDTRHLIDDTIARLAVGRTLIFLPHRLSTIRSCDQVIVLHNGRIEAMGPPRSLQGQSKIYRHLQYVEFNQFAAGEIEAGQMNA